MQISRRELERYRRSVESLGKAASSSVETALRLFMEANPSATPAQVREFAIGAVRQAVAKYGDASGRQACVLFDQVMELEGVDVPSAQLYAGPNQEAIEGTVRRQVGKILGEDPDVEGFVRQLSRYAADLTRQAARETTAANARRARGTRAGRNVAFARVPTRSDCCPWCAMLASRGFIYGTSANAEAGSHSNCTCVIVPGVYGRTRVGDYDPDEWKRKWRQSHEGGRGTAPSADRPKTKVEVFLGNLMDAMGDQRLYAAASGGYEWAARVARAENELLEWVRMGYPSARDHNGKQAILVLSSRGEICIGATALSHIDLDHPDEHGRPGVTIRGIIDSIENSLGTTGVEYDELGRPSYRSVGMTVTAAINPDSLELVTAWPTEEDDFAEIGIGRRSKKRRRKQ